MLYNTQVNLEIAKRHALLRKLEGDYTEIQKDEFRKQLVELGDIGIVNDRTIEVKIGEKVETMAQEQTERLKDRVAAVKDAVYASTMQACGNDVKVALGATLQVLAQLRAEKPRKEETTEATS